VVLIAGFLVLGPLLLIELSAIKDVLKEIRDEAFDMSSSMDEMRNSLHCVETDTGRLVRR
jgi:hypothetical protein